jgi:D-alanyl-D-alanine carboxypeptidase (penicillin-binding protein 5/6)
MSAQVVFAADLTTGVELNAANADAPVPPASTVKLVTALVVRNVLDPDERLTASEADMLDPTIFSLMGLQPGDTANVRDLLHGLLIPSGGDAALLLARETGRRLDPSAPDPVGRFVGEMNAVAASIGMRNSHFVNPEGSDAPDQYVTARDLVRATQRLLADPLLARIVATPSVSVEVAGPNPRALELVNTNQLLVLDDVFGIKTGTDEAAGQCLITGFWRGDNQIIGVVMGSQDRYADMAALMQHVDGLYKWQALGVGAFSLGATDELAAQGLTFLTRRTILMTQEQAATLSYEIYYDETGSNARRKGVVVFRLGERDIAKLPVFEARDGPAPP